MRAIVIVFAVATNGLYLSADRGHSTGIANLSFPCHNLIDNIFGCTYPCHSSVPLTSVHCCFCNTVTLRTPPSIGIMFRARSKSSVMTLIYPDCVLTGMKRSSLPSSSVVNGTSAGVKDISLLPVAPAILTCIFLPVRLIKSIVQFAILFPF